MEIKYRNVNNVRFSCAYLFRIIIDGKYFLVRDEQGRNTFQPVGGVYKYTDASFFDSTHAVQCTRFGNDSDLDCDLRLIVPRKYVQKFKRWYKKEKGRETPDNLYREFKEEILERIPTLNPALFETIEYKYCGEHIEVGRLGENDLQIRFADIVELVPTPEQTKAFLALMNRESSVYCFSTKEDIYNLGRTLSNQQQSISTHTYKILREEEKNLKRNKRTGKFYKCSGHIDTNEKVPENWKHIEKADISKPFTFISYNSLHSKAVWNFCFENRTILSNIWIDRKIVAENWQQDVENALASPECTKAILFINKEYLIRSTPCYREAELIVEHKIPHVVVLLDINQKQVVNILKEWIFCDAADKNKLRVFKQLFHYDDDTGHVNCSSFSLCDADLERVLNAYTNLTK